MWFNLLKLDLSSINIQTPIDTEAGNINIEESDKCRKKLTNFQKRILRMGKRNKGTSADGIELSDMSEKIACELVEKIDKMFNSINYWGLGPEIDERDKLSDGSEYVLVYSPSGKKILLVIAFGSLGHGYFVRTVIPQQDYLLMSAVRRHWEES